MRFSLTVVGLLVGLAQVGNSVAQESDWRPLPRGGPKAELMLQIGHQKMPQGFKLSPDGRILATTRADTTILWDVQTGRQLARYGEIYPTSYNGDPYPVAISADRQFMINRSALWRRRVRRVLEFDHVTKLGNGAKTIARFNDIVFSPDGQSFLTAEGRTWVGSDASIEERGGATLRDLSGRKLWSIPTRQPLQSADFSPNGRRFLTVSRWGEVKLWNAATGARLLDVRPPSKEKIDTPINDLVAFHPDGDRFATAHDGTVTLWQAESGRRIRDFEQLNIQSWRDRQFNIAFSHDGRFLAGGRYEIALWDVESGKIARTMKVDTEDVYYAVPTFVAFMPGDRELLIANLGKPSVEVRDTETGRRIRTLSLRPVKLSGISNVAFRSGADEFEVTTTPRMVWDHPSITTSTWSLSSGRLIGVQSEKDRRRDPVVTADGKFTLEVVNSDRREKTRTVLRNRKTGEIELDVPGVHPRIVSPDSRWLAVQSPQAWVNQDAGRSLAPVDVYDLSTGKKAATLEVRAAAYPYGSIVDAIVFSQNGKTLFTGSNSGVFVEWDTVSGREKRRFGNAVDETVIKQSGGTLPYMQIFAGGARLLTTNARASGTFVWDLSTGAQVASIPAPTNYHIAFSKDGRIAAIADHEDIRVWSLEPAREIAVLRGHKEWITALAVDAEGKRILSGSQEGMAILWDVATAKQLAMFAPLNNARDWFVITRQGYYLGSPLAQQMVSWRIAGEVFPVELYENVFRRPDLVADVLAGKTIKNVDSISGAHKPPRLRVDIEKTMARKATLRITATSGSPNSRIKSVRLFVDGRELQTPLKRQDQAANQATFRGVIDFPSGKTRAVIAAVATDDFGLQSPPVARTIVLPGAPGSVERSLYVLAVGVSRYQSGTNNLKYCHADAQALAATLARQQGLAFEKVFTRVLTDEQATAASIREGLNWLREGKRKDMAVVLFSGHGSRDREGRLYYVPHDDKEGFLPWGDVASALREVKCGSVLFLSDCCHAGAFGQQPSQDELAHALLREARVLVFAASRGLEVSLEKPELMHGAFTYAILKGLEGEADLIADGRITISELQAYVANRVKQLTDDIQHPHIPRANDFDPETVLVHVK